MNIIPRDKKELTFVEASKLTLNFAVDFFAKCSGEYLYVMKGGQVIAILSENDLDAIKNKEPLNLNIKRVTEATSNDEIYDLFLDDPYIRRVAQIENGLIKQEFFNADLRIGSIEKEENILCLRYISIFHDEIISIFKKEKIATIGVLGSSFAFNLLKSEFSKSNISISETETESDNFDCILDFKYDSLLRQYRPNKKLTSLRTVVTKAAIHELINYTKKRDIRLLVIQGPKKEKIVTLTNAERENFVRNKQFRDLVNDDCFYAQFCANKADYLYGRNTKIGSYGGWVRNDNGFCDEIFSTGNDFIHTSNGCRLTNHEPISPIGTIFLFGSCIVQGSCVTDEHTIASYLQMRLIRNGFQDWAVKNYGLGDGRSILNDVLHALYVDAADGDTFVLMDDWPKESAESFEEMGIEIVEATKWFNAKRADKVLFLDHPFHCNARANLIMAKAIEQLLNLASNSSKKPFSNYLKTKGFSPRKEYEIRLQTPTCQSYISGLTKAIGKNDSNSKNGVCLFAANPLTNGHVYLVQKALKRAPKIIVFILFENLFQFSFLDRFEMAINVFKEYENVIVYPSNRFFTSVSNFPEYFTKNPQLSAVDNIKFDAMVMTRFIMPIVGANTRILGSEKPKSVTYEYNKIVKSMDDKYGIKTIVIKRKKNKYGYISASAVRNFLKLGNFEAISSCVPGQVLKLLTKRNKT